MALRNKDIKEDILSLVDKFLSRRIGSSFEAVEQITYLLYMKHLDGDKYLSIYNDNSSKDRLFVIVRGNLRWSQFRSMDPKTMLEHVASKVFPFIKSLASNPKQPFARCLSDSVFLISDPSLLQEAVASIDRIFERVSAPETLGDVYEFLLDQVRPDRGSAAFRPPRHIIRLVTEILSPNYDDRICDPVCGMGSFLAGAYQSVLSKNVQSAYQSKDEDGFLNPSTDHKVIYEVSERAARTGFYGFDVDPTMTRLASMNLIMHGVEVPHIESADVLSPEFDRRPPQLYSVIIANPPFAQSVDPGRLSTTLLSSIRGEIVFLHRIFTLLAIDGRAGVIVPDSVLSGAQEVNRALRELLLKTCEVEAVISLPLGVFRPFTSVNVSIIIFRKRTLENKKAKNDGTGWHTQHVWFYNMASDGYSLDDNRTPLHNQPLPEIVGLYRAFDHIKELNTDRKNVHFFVPISDIIKNNLDLCLPTYREVEHTTTQHESPKELLASLIKLEEEILQDTKALNNFLK